MLDRTVYGNTLLAWAIAAAIAAAVLFGAFALRRILVRRYERFRESEEVELGEVFVRVLARTRTVFLVVLALYVAQTTLDLPPRPHRFATVALTLVGFWQMGVWGATGVVAWLERRKHQSGTDHATSASLGVVSVVLRGVVWVLVLLLALDNLGVNITSLVAGLGIGGVAIALAVQNILGDLFASLSIALDKPFTVGDLVYVGEVKGRIENVGVKSTRIRSIEGEQIIVSNADLLKSRIRNFGRMSERRVLQRFGVVYETARDRLAGIPDRVKTIVEAQEKTRFVRCHLATLGDSAIEFELVYFVTGDEYETFMDMQQAVNLALIGAFADDKIAFAYPTQRLYVSATNDGDADPQPS